MWEWCRARFYDIKKRKSGIQNTAQEGKRERNILCSIVHNIVSRDVISEIHTRKSQSFLCDIYKGMEREIPLVLLKHSFCSFFLLWQQLSGQVMVPIVVGGGCTF